MLVAAASTGDDYPPRNRESLMLKADERLEEHPVILPDVDISHGENHDVVVRTTKFFAHSGRVTLDQRNAVGNYSEGVPAHTQCCSELQLGGFGDRDRVS